MDPVRRSKRTVPDFGRQPPAGTGVVSICRIPLVDNHFHIIASRPAERATPWVRIALRGGQDENCCTPIFFIRPNEDDRKSSGGQPHSRPLLPAENHLCCLIGRFRTLVQFKRAVPAAESRSTVEVAVSTLPSAGPRPPARPIWETGGDGAATTPKTSRRSRAISGACAAVISCGASRG